MITLYPKVGQRHSATARRIQWSDIAGVSLRERIERVAR
jgi:hypothetical protein